jgi:hypothetical protein
VRRQDITVGGQPSVLIETSESASDSDHGPSYRRDNVIFPTVDHKAFIVGQLRLPQSIGGRKWRAARSMFEAMINSLRLTERTGCIRSQIWHCGDFYWTEKPVDSQATVKPAQAVYQAQVGEPVTVVVNVEDPDAQHIDLTGVDWGDEPSPRAEAATSSILRIDDIVRRPDRDPRPHGPWPPPDKEGGTRSFTRTHVYKKAGKYTAGFSARTTASGSTVPEGHDPYGNDAFGSAIIEVAAPTTTTDSTDTTNTTNTTSPRPAASETTTTSTTR